MKVQNDIQAALLAFGLPIMFVAMCSVSALLLWVLAPKRFRAARLLLCLPLTGMLLGFPVGMAVETRPGLFEKLQYGAITALWFGTSCTTFFMLVGFVILGIATLVRAAASSSEPVARSKRGKDDFEDE